jgi:hypothetical protein
MEQKKLLHILARHDQFLRRVARMLAAGQRGEQMPKDAEFHTEEVQHLDSSTADLVVELVGSVPSKLEWLPPGRYPYEKEYWKNSDHLNWLQSYQEGLLRSKNYLSVFVATSMPEVHMGDKIAGDKIGGDKITGDKTDVGAAHVVMGSQAQAGNISTQGAVYQGEPAPGQVAELAEELAKLRKQMRLECDPDNSQHDIEVGAVALAEQAARSGNSSGALSHLKSVGRWCLDIATKLGVSLATEAIKQSTGLGK